MESEDQLCAICLNSIDNVSPFSPNKDEIQSNSLISELKGILGKWYNHLPHNLLCSRCIYRIVSIVKAKMDILGLILNSYSVAGLNNYLALLQSFILKICPGFNEEHLKGLDSSSRFAGNMEQESSRDVPYEENRTSIDFDKRNVPDMTSAGFTEAVSFEDDDFPHPTEASDALCSTDKNELPGNSLNEYVRKQHDIKIFNCGICQFHSMSRYELQAHISKEHKVGNRYVCKTCSSTFKRKYSCIFHQCVHSDIRPFSCKYCGRGFNWQSLLTKHERLHTGEKPYKCDLCDQAFRLLEQLHKHKKSHNTGELVKVVADTREVCEKCGKLYSSHDALLRHLKTHDRKHQCQLCDFSTNDDEEYAKHQNRHSKARRHHCLICHKAFIRREHLTRHLRIHTGETPYRCSTCGKGFAQSQDVKKHERTHTGVKPYVCFHCSRSFTSKISLRRHKCSIPDAANDYNSQDNAMENEIFSLAQQPPNLCLPDDIVEMASLTPSSGDLPVKSLHAEMQPMAHIIDQFSITLSVPTSCISTDMSQSYSDSMSAIDHTFDSSTSGVNPVEPGNFLPNLCPSMLASADAQLSLMMPASCIDNEVATIIPDITQQNILVLGLQNMKTCSDESESQVAK